MSDLIFNILIAGIVAAGLLMFAIAFIFGDKKELREATHD